MLAMINGTYTVYMHKMPIKRLLQHKDKFISLAVKAYQP